MKNLIVILGIAVAAACGPGAGPGDDGVASGTSDDGGDDGGGRDDGGGVSLSGAAVTTDGPGPGSTGEMPEGTTTGFDPSTTGDTGVGETGPLSCDDQPTIQACRDAGCMVTVGRRWNATNVGGYCVDPGELISCTFNIACPMPEFACPLFAAPYVVEIVEGCLPEDHTECDAPAAAAPPCP